MTIAEPQFPMVYSPMGALIMNPPPPPPIIIAQQPRPVPVGVPVPVAVPVPVGIQIEEEKTSTTTTQSPRRILKIYMPWGQFPFPVSAPALPPPELIPASNCTNKLIPQPIPLQPPGFAMPFPMSIPAPPPVIMVPAPPIHYIKSSSSGCDDSSSSRSSGSSYEDSDSDSDLESSVWKIERRRKKKFRKRKKRYGILRSNRRFFSDSSGDSDEKLKPMLSYVAKNGDVKINKRLSNKDAALLMADDKKPQQVQKVQVIVGNDSNEKPRVKVIAESPKASKRSKQKGEKKKIVLRRFSQQIVSGNKELVFRPPGNKKISNFSMSFNIAE